MLHSLLNRGNQPTSLELLGRLDVHEADRETLEVAVAMRGKLISGTEREESKDASEILPRRLFTHVTVH